MVNIYIKVRVKLFWVIHADLNYIAHKYRIFAPRCPDFVSGNGSGRDKMNACNLKYKEEAQSSQLARTGQMWEFSLSLEQNIILIKFEGFCLL